MVSSMQKGKKVGFNGCEVQKYRLDAARSHCILLTESLGEVEKSQIVRWRREVDGLRGNDLGEDAEGELRREEEVECGYGECGS